MNNFVDIIYSKSDCYPQISINGEKINPYMELADLISDDIFIWAGKLFRTMDDELCENYTINLTGHPFQMLVLESMKSQSQYCAAIRFTPIEYKISIADKLAYAVGLNQHYQLGIQQKAENIRFCSNEPERFASLVPCSEDAENYYISAENELPVNDAKYCVILSEQLGFVKEQNRHILYVPVNLLPILVNYLNLYHLHMAFIAKVFSVAGKLNLIREERLKYEAYVHEEYRLDIAAIPDTMETGDSFCVSYNYYPQQFEDPGVRISTNNPSVVFTFDDMLKAESAGSAIIMVMDKFGALHGTYQINVEHHNYVSDISIILPSTTLQINEMLHFKCLISPNDAEDMHKVHYSVSDTSIAAFSGKNEIYGIAPGRVKVTVSAPRVSKSFYLSVLPMPKDVLLPTSSLKMPINADAYIDCVVVPTNASPMPAVSWKSSNPSVVKVVETNDYSCKVASYGIGSAVLTCTLDGMDISKSMKITVEKEGGCYVATAVYGSYNCPEVWVLRRYRDQKLASHGFGRAFIKLYYAVSPTVVKLFGKTRWFNHMWRGILDKKIRKLKACGYEDTPYND